MAPLGEITSFPDVLGGLLGIAIGALVIVYRERLASYAAEGFHMGGRQASLARVYGMLSVLAILIAVGSIFVL